MLPQESFLCQKKQRHTLHPEDSLKAYLEFCPHHFEVKLVWVSIQCFSLQGLDGVLLPLIVPTKMRWSVAVCIWWPHKGEPDTTPHVHTSPLGLGPWQRGHQPLTSGPTMVKGASTLSEIAYQGHLASHPLRPDPGLIMEEQS